MEIQILLMQLALILVAARFFGEVAVFLGIPSVVGELIAGVVIGPSVFGWVEISASIEVLAEIEVVLLLFEVGLETDVKRLFSEGSKAFLVASAGVIFPLVFGIFISHFFLGLSPLISFFIGGTLIATSLGIALKVLRNIKQDTSREGHVILGAAILDDIIGILLLSIFYEFARSENIGAMQVGLNLTRTILFMIFIPLIAKKISIIIEKWDKKSDIPGLISTMTFSLILISAKLAHLMGAPALLGGFSVGIALSKNFVKSSPAFSQKVEEQMRPIVLVLSPIFFVGIGLSLKLQEIAFSSSFIWKATGLLTVGAIIGKLLSGFVFKGSTLQKRLMIGMSMVPRGEMGLIFASVGLASGLLDKPVYTALILVIIITTLLAPCFLKMFCKKEVK